MTRSTSNTERAVVMRVRRLVADDVSLRARIGSSEHVDVPGERRQRREDVRQAGRSNPTLAPRMDERRSRSVACVSLSKLKTVARAGVVGWWRRRTADPVLRVDLRRTGAVSCGVVIGSFVLAWVIASTGSRLLLGLVFVVFVVAAVTLFAVVIALSQASGDEID